MFFLLFFQKRFLYFCLFLFSCSPLLTYAECRNFSTPTEKNSSLLFYNCTIGDLQMIDKKNKISPLRGEKESLGAFIHALSWSPDGTRAFILSENISAVVQSLRFATPEREYGSLNWWLYDLKTGDATLLDQKIRSIGWATNTSALYNWNNTEIDLATVQNLSLLGDHQKIADLRNDATNLDTIISPISASALTLFPLEKGLYSISLTQPQEARYISLPQGIQKMTLNPFDANTFLLQSGTTLFSFSAQGKVLTPIDTDFSSFGFSFIDTNTLAVASPEGTVFLYNLSTREKKEISLGGYEHVSDILQGNEGTFVFMIEDNAYIKTVVQEMPIPFQENSEYALTFRFKKQSDNSLILEESGNIPSLVKKRETGFSLTSFLEKTPASGGYNLNLYDTAGSLFRSFFFSDPKSTFLYSIPYFENAARFTVLETKTGTLLLDGSLDRFLPCASTGTCPKTSPPQQSLPIKQAVNTPPSPNTPPATAPQPQTGISLTLIISCIVIFFIIFSGTFYLLRKRLAQK